MIIMLNMRSMINYKIEYSLSDYFRVSRQPKNQTIGLTEGQRLIVLTDEHGIALIPDEAFMANTAKAMEYMGV